MLRFFLTKIFQFRLPPYSRHSTICEKNTFCLKTCSLLYDTATNRNFLTVHRKKLKVAPKKMDEIPPLSE